ncbi:unnamed protein product [Porites lobata]|uniref:Death domain-containing protein n=1 Tax=Porites lobata TaxID=104759 RepID=A0ABN8P4N3_9CNID|nr:unnamed protein product [Porites lobata]
MIEKEKLYCTKECCIELLVRWMRQNGTEATVGKLKKALAKIELKNVGENLISGLSCCRCYCINQRLEGVDHEESKAPYQVSLCDKMICEMSDKLRASLKEVYKISDPWEGMGDTFLPTGKRFNKCHDDTCKLIGEMSDDLRVSLRKEVSKMEAKIKALEIELSEERQMRQDKEQEVSQLMTRIEGLEEELSIPKQKGHDEINEQQEGDLATDTDQLARDREHRIDVRLKNINEQLRIYVTSPLQVQEVKQDQLKTAVKLDLLTHLSKRLQEFYTEALRMVKEACKCSEDLRKDFYDLVYHGLRAEHYELVHRVKDLESSQEEMSEEEKKKFGKLQFYQRGRQSQAEVDQLDKLWSSLFTPPGRRQKTAMSADPMGQNKPRDSKKVTRYTDPDDIRRKLKLRGEDTRPAAPSTSSYGQPEEESRLTLRKMKSTVESVIQTISKKKEGGEKQLRDC